MLVYLRDRPLVLTRYPDGITGPSFFQKDAPEYAPEWLRRETMWSEQAEREIRYFIADDVPSLRYIANMAAIPLHVWASRVGNLERPDWCILDLDPKEAPFSSVVTVALAVRALCVDVGLPSFIKTTGSTGLHILLPLGRMLTHEQSRHLGELLARVVVGTCPDLATVTRVIDRREGKVYVDYLQNGHGKLMVSPFSVRPVPGALVSMPLRWEEVGPGLDLRDHSIRNAVERMEGLGEDPMAGVLTTVPDLSGVLARLATRR
jgi:bifunctional non-homologous end joining protein LigD